MGTEISVWEINQQELNPLNNLLREEGRKEPYDLEPWIASKPEILGPDLIIIGRQVITKSGRIDLLGIDRDGNIIIIELKRDQTNREALMQAIDYASDVAGWDDDKINDICKEYTKNDLSKLLFDIGIENISINEQQRILLVGFSVESALERMVEWLSEKYGVNINVLVLKYIKTKSGDELLAKTTILSEELAQERVNSRKALGWKMSKEPGTYSDQELTEILTNYLMKSNITNRRIRTLLLACLKNKTVTRDELKEYLIKAEPGLDAARAGSGISAISVQLGIARNDFLRQVIYYENPNYEWEKNNFSIREQYIELVKQVLQNVDPKME
jgi:RecB family endonuclease NucS